MTEPENITNSIEFSEYIENKCKNTGNYIDTVIEYCSKLYISLEDVKPFIHPTLKEKIKAEAISSNLMKSLGQLDF